jgi:hypothetical protein
VARAAEQVLFQIEKEGITAAGPFPNFKGFPIKLNTST